MIFGVAVITGKCIKLLLYIISVIDISSNVAVYVIQVNLIV